MKILFIITQSEFGGAQNFVYKTAEYLTSQNYDVTVAFGQKNNDLKSKIKNQKLRHLKRTPGLISAVLAIREIKKLLIAEKPDVLFLNSTTAGILGSIAAWLTKLQTTNYKLQTIYRIGGWAFKDPRPKYQNKIILWLEKITARFKDKIIVNCEIDKQLALKYKIAPENKIVKIHNGLDVNQMQFLTKQQARAS